MKNEKEKYYTANFKDGTGTVHEINCEGKLIQGCGTETFDNEQSAQDAINEFCNGDADLEKKCFISEFETE